MIVERFMDEQGLWAYIVAGPCPFCRRTYRHEHLLDDPGITREVITKDHPFGGRAADVP